MVFTKWPHPFLNIRRDFSSQKLSPSFPKKTNIETKKKLFEIPTDDHPHIIFLSLESFRAKNVGCLGAKNPLSPHFDELSKRGILFTNFHATGNLTNRSIIATLFGIPAPHHPCHLGYFADLSLVGLPKIMRENGYHPAVIQGGALAFDHEAEFFEKQGFQTILGKRDLKKPGSSWGVYDEHLMIRAADWLEKQTSPTFLNLYTITNHHPWIHPKKKNGFLNTFSYTDSALKLFIDALEKKNLLKKTILFIYGDHGQQLEDRDPYFEINRYLYQDNLHVPLLILAEGRISKREKIETIASQIDLLPTLLDLLNIKTPHQSLGKSLLSPSSSPIFFSHPFDTPMMGIRDGNWKYIVSKEKEELYNLKTDPEEKENRIEEGTNLKEKTENFFKTLDSFYFEKPKQEKESSLHLDFKNSLEMRDETLFKIAKEYPNLSSLSLEGCLLLTDEGLQKLTECSFKIEKLLISGLSDVTSIGWGPLPHLVHLKAFDCPKLKLDWIQGLPSLKILQIGSMNLKDEDLFQLAKKQKKPKRSLPF